MCKRRFLWSLLKGGLSREGSFQRGTTVHVVTKPVSTLCLFDSAYNDRVSPLPAVHAYLLLGREQRLGAWGDHLYPLLTDDTRTVRLPGTYNIGGVLRYVL